MNLPYFITWTSQRDAKTLPIETCTNDYFLSNGQKWLNLSSISYQASFGLKNKDITKAIQKQAQKFSLASPKHIFQLKDEVSKRYIEKSKGAYKVFFTQSGSEGIENALKMVRQVSGKRIILANKESYHGASMGALSITGDWRNKDHVLPNQWTRRIPSFYEDPNAEKLNQLIQKLGADKIAAICLETITGGNGVHIPPNSWYKAIQKICKDNGIFLILDEVVCAVHRTGPFFGFQNYKNLKPDIIVTAKAVTGGYFPLGINLVSSSIAKFYETHTLSAGLTNYAHPLGLSAAKAVLDIVDAPEFAPSLKRKTDIFHSYIKQFKQETRAIGLLAAIELRDHPLTVQDLFKAGIYASIQSNRLILAPHFTIKEKNLIKGLKAIQKLVL